MLRDNFSEAVSKDLNNLDIFSFEGYASKNSEVLNFLYKKNIIDDSLIEEALKNPVIKCIKGEIKRNLHPADHFFKPEYLAYTLENDLLSKEEIKQICFDHGDTTQSFIRQYGRKNLLSDLREELLNPKPLLKLDDSWDPHP